MSGGLFEYLAPAPEEDGALTKTQAGRLSEILVSVGLSSSQSDQIIRRFNDEASNPKGAE